MVSCVSRGVREGPGLLVSTAERVAPSPVEGLCQRVGEGQALTLAVAAPCGLPLPSALLYALEEAEGLLEARTDSCALTVPAMLRDAPPVAEPLPPGD